MVVKERRGVGPWLYGVLWCVGLPVGLVAWASATGDVVPLPAVESVTAGAMILVLGVSLMFAGWYALTVYGRGLPMNAYPPTQYVTRGVYRFYGHPIYVGFLLACVGVSVGCGSASGLWLVSPVVALSATALVLGHERDALSRLSRDVETRRPLVSLPRDDDGRPSGWERLSIFLLVILPWTVAFEAVYRLGIPPDAVEAYFPFERTWPVLQWTEPVYASVYLFVGLVPFVMRKRSHLRRFAIAGLLATAVVTLVYLTVPVVAPPRDFTPHSLAGRMLTWERAMSHTVGAFPSFHVIWTLFAASAWGRRGPRFRIAAWTAAVLIMVSCVTTGMHAIADIVSAAVFYFVFWNYRAVWKRLRDWTEILANSWKEWRVGPVRIISHGAYAAIGGGGGLWIAASLAGPTQVVASAAVAVCALVGAGLWAQKLEGASGLSRPFGFYGSVFGGITGCLVAGVMGFDVLLLLAALAVSAPWVQGIGRLRCLVQGCCHGRPTRDGVGIRYWAPRSRVCTMTAFRGVPVHPTPLYSILANVVTMAILVRLWSLDAPLGVVAGAFLILNGVARFAEEAYRGEPQTIVVGGLRIYQWAAAVSVMIGVVLTMVSAAPAPPFRLTGDVTVIAISLLFGAMAGIAMGVDFPNSNRRFARLAT